MRVRKSGSGSENGSGSTLAEEPTAGVAHGGICEEGAAGRLPLLGTRRKFLTETTTTRVSAKTLSPASRARRRFLKHAALAAACTSSATMLPVTSQPATGLIGAHSSSGCLDVKSPMKEVEDKVAFITGGSSGIGLGIARVFSDAGLKVLIGYRTKEHLEEAMRSLKSFGYRVHPISVDVTDRLALERQRPRRCRFSARFTF